MKNLIRKEFQLSAHPTMYIFLIMDAMLLIPSYPYYIAFIYTCLAVFFVFLTGRENKDVFYTVLLPIRKRDAVKARCWMIAIIELAQMIVAIPFAIIGRSINPNPQGNMTGIQANVAFFGLVFIMYALFNVILIPIFYKTAYKAGSALVWSGFAVLIYIAAAESSVKLIKPLKTNLDTSNPDMMIRQIPILAAGILIYGLTMILAYKKAANNFEKVDL